MSRCPDTTPQRQAGWGFEYLINGQWMNVVSTWSGVSGPGFWCSNPNSAFHESILLTELGEHPVFRRNPSAMFSSNLTFAARNEILAKGLPALSPAAGKTAIPYLTSSKNFNMNTAFKPDNGAWGRGDNHMYKKRWLHSDMEDMAFFYTHKLFEKLVKLGEIE